MTKLTVIKIYKLILLVSAWVLTLDRKVDLPFLEMLQPSFSQLHQKIQSIAESEVESEIQTPPEEELYHKMSNDDNNE